MFENGKPDIVLKRVNCFDIKRTPFIIICFLIIHSEKCIGAELLPENIFLLGIVVLYMINKTLVIVLIIDFYSGYGPGS